MMSLIKQIQADLKFIQDCEMTCEVGCEERFERILKNLNKLTEINCSLAQTNSDLQAQISYLIAEKKGKII